MSETASSNVGSESAKAIKLPDMKFAHMIVEKTFNFRANKELGTKRPALTIQFPTITWPGLVDIVNVDDTASQEEQDRAKRAIEYILALITDQVELAVRERISDADNPVTNQDQLDIESLFFDKLIFQTASDRRGAKISDEAWKAFAEDYVAVVARVAPDRKPTQVKQALELFLKKIMPVRTNKQVLTRLQQLLAEWFAGSENTEEHSEVYDFLSERIRRYLNVEDKDLLTALG